MLLQDFTRQCHDFWDAYFRRVAGHLSRGEVDSGSGRMYFPCFLICTRTKQHLIAELLGTSENYDGLTVRQRKQESTAEFFGQFRGQPTTEYALPFGRTQQRLRHVCLMHDIDGPTAERRFPMAKFLKSRLVRANSTSCLLSFTPTFQDVEISDTILVHTDGTRYRAKYIVQLLITKNSISPRELTKTLQWLEQVDADHVKGVTTCGSDEIPNIVSSQLQNLFLTPHLHETTIGEFLNQHPEIISACFNADKYVYEPHLSWIERSADNGDDAINPDLMIRRQDGNYDIVDFKTAALDHRKTTKGDRNRRRFIDPLSEGIAQLYNYAHYFEFTKK